MGTSTQASNEQNQRKEIASRLAATTLVYLEYKAEYYLFFILGGQGVNSFLCWSAEPWSSETWRDPYFPYD